MAVLTIMLCGGLAFGKGGLAPVAAVPGIYSLGHGGKPIPEEIFRNPLVRGVILRLSWRPIERSPGHHDWAYFHREIERAAASGKTVGLRVIAGGGNTPDWVYRMEGVKKFRFHDTDPYHKENFGRDVAIPVFWDPILLENKFRLIKAFGHEFAADPHVTSVSVACANASTDDWSIPAKTPRDVEEWERLGFSFERMVDACKRSIDATAEAFPRQAIVLSIGRTEFDRPVERIASAVVDYGYRRYPDRFMAITSTLSARTPDPRTENPTYVWKVLYDRRPFAGAQMLWWVTGDETFRMNGNTRGNEKEIFGRSMTTGLRYGMRYFELYEEDLLNPNLTDIIEQVAREIGRP